MRKTIFNRSASVLAAALAVGGLAFAAPASAETKSAVTASEIEAILTEAGLSPTMTEDAATGAPAASGKLGEIVFWVRALDCTGAPLACENLMFFANFGLGRSVTPKDYVVINSYNDSKVFGRAYVIEAQSEIGVDYVIELGGGVSKDHIAQNISRWADVVSAFIDSFRAGHESS
jgi:hypothetical protein